MLHGSALLGLIKGPAGGCLVASGPALATGYCQFRAPHGSRLHPAALPSGGARARGVGLSGRGWHRGAVRARAVPDRGGSGGGAAGRAGRGRASRRAPTHRGSAASRSVRSAVGRPLHRSDQRADHHRHARRPRSRGAGTRRRGRRGLWCRRGWAGCRNHGAVSASRRRSRHAPAESAEPAEPDAGGEAGAAGEPEAAGDRWRRLVPANPMPPPRRSCRRMRCRCRTVGSQRVPPPLRWPPRPPTRQHPHCRPRSRSRRPALVAAAGRTHRHRGPHRPGHPARPRRPPRRAARLGPHPRHRRPAARSPPTPRRMALRRPAPRRPPDLRRHHPAPPHTREHQPGAGPAAGRPAAVSWKSTSERPCWARLGRT